jgi:exodeoxyribonuclease VII large subunit
MEQHTIGTLIQLFQYVAQKTLQSEQKIGQIVVTGRLGPLKDEGYPTFYEVPLIDDPDRIWLDVPKVLVERLHLQEGHYVSVTGTLKANLNPTTKRIGFRVNVSDIQPISLPQQARKEQSILGHLHALRSKRVTFPLREDLLRVVVICPKSAKVLEDFQAELAKMTGYVETMPVRVNMNDPDSISAAIKQAQADVIAIIRGGGSAEEFAVFDDSRVLEALAAQTSYRVVGLGHTSDTTLLDFIADYAARTPTEAAAHIYEQAESHRWLVDACKQLKQQCAGLEADNKRLQIVSTEAMSIKRKTIRLVAVVGLLCFLIGVVLALWLGPH